MIGVELFAGAGGLSLGASMAGIKTKFAVEIDPYAVETYLHNHKNVEVFKDDIRNLEHIPFEKGSEQTILYGGPPCQGFSLSNQKTRNRENEKNWLFKEFARITKSFRPDWFVLENVSGILKTDKGRIWEEIVAEFKNLGYTVSFKLLNSADFGIPQKRNRVFLVGSLHGIEFDFARLQQHPVVTVEEAISDLPSLKNGSCFYQLEYKADAQSAYSKSLRNGSQHALDNFVTQNSQLVVDRYKHIPQGGNWESIPSALMNNYKDYTRCHGGIYHRLSTDKPSVVIGNYRKNMLVHPFENRGLSVREAARLQSFPDWFEFKGPLTQRQQQVGNAVPPLLAKAVFDEIMKF